MNVDNPLKEAQRDAAPLLSVIVPAYQAEKTIGRLLNSLLAWNREGLEIIVVDDGSTDATASLVSSMALGDPRIRLFSQPNRGRSAARNTGVLFARGEWIMFADSDDYYLESWSEEICMAIERGNDLSIFGMRRSDRPDGFEGATKVFPAGLSVEISAGVMRKALITGSVKNKVEHAECFEWNACWARLYRKSIIEEVASANGGDAFPAGLKFSEDCLFNLAYLKAMGNSGVVCDYAPIYYWDLGSSSTVAKVSPDDPESLIAFSEAADAMGGSSGFSNEVPEIIAMEASSHFRRSASLPVSQLRAASKSWHRVMESGVLDKCAGLLGEFIGGKAWAYKPALALLSAGKPFSALMIAHGAAAAGSLLKSLRRG